ncbi:MAG: glutamine synthetase III [Bacteroidales bacterium]|nr:glutamine synthetase III [Bacteroidales bacterium]MCF8343427.1 glutamine synthetase III [Bacteroidales bacterium]MCF8349882.1 glutamine synthetase III [Bacteroidales bacterium]MCF8376763.1 glutamine synthetase III [Bacteroidales bacterium]
MENFRFDALKITLSRKSVKVDPPSDRVSDFFGEMTFGRKAMREFLSEDAYKMVISAIDQGMQIDRKIADQVASAMKSWATSKGAVHYTHWFHPLTGATAEKHDAFIDIITEDGRAIENFSGDQLVQQEPDASSFPSGGIRNTFEARGYTAWDPTSPAFIIDRTLCIPTIFVSYTGEALDYKTPLLKALNAVDRAAVDVCKYFDKDVKKVNATLGWEQEYFLVDAALYAARPDLVLTGRTVFGHASAKDQQLSDHYFGTIQERVMDFMKDFEYEAYRLGIPIKTRHNEVAPNQFECAPVYEEANLAVDHNQLLMHLLKRVARNHDFMVLLHEKPFAKVNGSGKHNNWSLQTDKGDNLLSPGKDKKSNLRFLTFMVNILKSIREYDGLLAASIMNSGNEHRLGGNEAPPAIISVFIGSQLSKTLDEIEKKGVVNAGNENGLNISIPKIPEILPDNTDRNRTSPFAFTGNKFEFRAVGSSATCSNPMIILNLMLVDQLKKFKKDVDELIGKKVRKNEAILKVVKRYIMESRDIRFEGNNYSEEWVKEAAKRGLSNVTSVPEALKAYLLPSTIQLFAENNVLSERELKARFNTYIENYTKQIQIESRVIGDLATNHILPVAIKYQNILIENARGLKEVLDNKTYVKLSRNQVTSIKKISEHISEIVTNVNLMKEERKLANRLEDAEEKAFAYRGKVLPYLEVIRRHVDKLELMVDDKLWPLPKYRELLFLR